MIDFDRLERLFIEKKFVELTRELDRLIAQRTPQLTSDEFERVVSLKLRLLIVVDDVASAVTYLRNVTFQSARIPFDLFLICFESFEEDVESLQSFALSQLKQTAASMVDESLSQLEYEQLRLDYERLLELCLFHVLVPQGDKHAAQQLLQADSILTVEKKQFFNSLIDELEPSVITTQQQKQIPGTSERPFRPTVLSFDDTNDTHDKQTTMTTATSTATNSKSSIGTNKLNNKNNKNNDTNRNNNNSLINHYIAQGRQLLLRHRFSSVLVTLLVVAGFIAWIRQRRRRNTSSSIIDIISELFSP